MMKLYSVVFVASLVIASSVRAAPLLVPTDRRVIIRLIGDRQEVTWT
jgi:hypothetical protein